LIVAIAAVLLASSCSRPYVTEDPEKLAALDEAWDARKSWPPLGPVDYHVPLYATYLEGLRICLDPGHGGDAALKGYKRGPTEFREAVMDLGVARYLKGFLEAAGAEVLLTRDSDVEVGLDERTRIANEWGADLFLSIHHNAAGDPNVNRATTWFHAGPDYRPSNLDFARYLQQGLTDALRLPQVDGNPLKSDYLMYPGMGFAVIRQTHMTGCLTEASFFTNPYEEYRLEKDWYWKREAYGLFLGFARYVWAGIPKPELLAPEPGAHTPEKRPEIVFQARTGLEDRASWAADRPWILKESVRVTVDGRGIPAEFDEEKGTITARPPEPLKAGEHTVLAGYRNYNGNYAHPVPFTFVVDPPPETVVVTAEPPAIPPVPSAVARVRVKVFDQDREPVLDGTRVVVGAPAGTCEPPRGVTRDGEFLAYFSPPERPGASNLIAVAGGRFGAGEVDMKEFPDRSMVALFVLDASTGEPLAGVACSFSVDGTTREYETAPDGWGLALSDLSGSADASLGKEGYLPEEREAPLRLNDSWRADIALEPVLDGVLHGKTILLDARFGGDETGDVAKDGTTAAAWNLELARALSAGLRDAGATSILLRKKDETLTAEDRVERANRRRGADLYVRLAHGLPAEGSPELTVDIFPGSERGGRIASAFIERASRELGITNAGVEGVDDVEIHKSSMLAVGVEFRTMDYPGFAGRGRPDLIRAEAGVILRGLASYYGWSPDR